LNAAGSSSAAFTGEEANLDVERPRRVDRQDDVRPGGHELRGERGQAGLDAIRRAHQDAQVAAFPVPELAQGLGERSERRVVLQALRMQHADHLDRSLLRLDTRDGEDEEARDRRDPGNVHQLASLGRNDTST
jgi:hypothetical protein